MSDAVKNALRWLAGRNGDGLFDLNGVVVAAGERAPFMRSTWNKLVAAGWVELYANRKRLRITPRGVERRSTLPAGDPDVRDISPSNM